MARIPIQSLVSARQTGVQIQPGAFQETAQATVNLLSSVGGAVDEVKRQFDRAQDIQNQSDILNRKREIRDAQGQFQNDMLKGNVPPAKWGTEWKKRLDELQTKIGLNGKDLPPAVRREVEAEFKSFAPRSFIQISGAALIENRKLASQNLSRDTDFYTRNHDYDGARASLESAKNYLPEEEYEDRKRSIDYAEISYDREVRMREDPEAYAKWAEETDELSDLQKVEHVERAKSEMRRLEATEIDMLEREMERGDSSSIQNEEDLKTALDKSEFLSDATKDAIINNYRKRQPLSDEEEWELYSAFDDLRALGEKVGGGKEYREAYNKLQAKVNSYGNRPNTGGFRSDIVNFRPSVVASRSDSQRREYLKDANAMVARMAKLVAAGDTKEKSAREGKYILSKTDFSDDEKVKAEFGDYETYLQEMGGAEAKRESELSTRQVVIERALFEVAREFVENAPPGKVITSMDIKNHLEDPKIKNPAIVRALKQDGVQFSFQKGLDLINERTSEAARLRGNLSTMLPSIAPPVGDEGDAGRSGFSAGQPTVKAQVTRYGYEGDKYQNKRATSKGSKYEDTGNRGNVLERGVSVALPPKTARELGIDLKAGEFVEAKIGGKWQRFRVDDTAADHSNHRIDFFDPDGTRIKIDGNQIDIRKAQ